MAETKPGTPPVRARIGNTGEDGRRQPAPCLSHRPRDEELPINHLGLRGRIDDLVLVEVRAVEAAVAGQQPVRLAHRVGSDEEVGDELSSSSASPVVLAPNVVAVSAVSRSIAPKSTSSCDRTRVASSGL